MDIIRQRMIERLRLRSRPYEGYINRTDNNKLLVKLDWNVNQNNNVSFRYNYLDAKHDLPPHPFVLSFNEHRARPQRERLPFHNSGYTMNNELNSLRR